MSTCEDYEIQVEMRLYGALHDESTVAQLEAHLADCASCRRYVDRVATSAVFEETPRTSAVDWEHLQQRAVRRAQAYEKAPWRMAALMPFIVLVIGWAAGVGVGLGAAGLGLVIVATAFVLTRREVAELRRVAEGGQEFLSALRHDLDRGMRRLNTSMWIELSMGLVVLAISVLSFSRNPAAPGRLAWLYAAWSAFLLGSFAVHRWVTKPRLQAELAELTEEGNDAGS